MSVVPTGLHMATQIKIEFCWMSDLSIYNCTRRNITKLAVHINATLRKHPSVMSFLFCFFFEFKQLSNRWNSSLVRRWMCHISAKNNCSIHTRILEDVDGFILNIVLDLMHCVRTPISNSDVFISATRIFLCKRQLIGGSIGFTTTFNSLPLIIKFLSRKFIRFPNTTSWSSFLKKYTNDIFVVTYYLGIIILKQF
ncbi:hypothetical protein AGLY_002848 [Aphis glycines]|uniref:Uncharacterized protein n=1 Tax=Aphis glycines TaxID=307491 RepID=A0A6G0U1U4_APHGL|nr:hypothetical protein AGLY_002848 [Aphis glycines]